MLPAAGVDAAGVARMARVADVGGKRVVPEVDRGEARVALAVDLSGKGVAPVVTTAREQVRSWNPHVRLAERQRPREAPREAIPS